MKLWMLKSENYILCKKYPKDRPHLCAGRRQATAISRFSYYVFTSFLSYSMNSIANWYQLKSQLRYNDNEYDLIFVINKDLQLTFLSTDRGRDVYLTDIYQNVF